MHTSLAKVISCSIVAPRPFTLVRPAKIVGTLSTGASPSFATSCDPVSPRDVSEGRQAQQGYSTAYSTPFPFKLSAKEP